MKKIFAILVCALVSCTNSEEAIKAYQQQKDTIGLQSAEKQNELLGQSPMAFKQSMQAIAQQYAEILKNLPADFAAKEEKANRYQQLAIVSEYLLNHRKYTEEEAPAIKELEALCATVDLDNAADFNDYPDYQILVRNLFQWRIYSHKVQYEFDDPWGKILADFKALKSENIKQALAPLIIEGVSPTSASATNEEIIALVKQLVKDNDLLNTLSKHIDLVNKLKAGQPFPALPVLTDLNDKEVKYEHLPLKGKLLFIDIWATYCPDCRKELPDLEALQEDYKTLPITFVSISVDRDKEAWKAMVKEKKLRGIHLYASPETKELFKELYDLRSIPRYMLIDEKGNIINANLPMPSDKNLKELITEKLIVLTNPKAQ
ncbi:TlpA family protein disulfide reductase [Capnocytophaga genosp. AHN8471]|uniref:TlpA family protein disulfide reductase n=1 Tax=Capnocytophaga genosp. AHN8471 TaxID=327574 RepID=UPI0019314495|nr:TlpA disulfide reductase family protein [Capnocytophaga genosp. AHN8471]MBM0658332.1 TlpA family protein disulfide reductase [Capnocytophaga genosp. AHN8471]